jgi:GT2 family glycosyltransferase
MHETGLWKVVRSVPFGQRAQPFFDRQHAADVPWVLGAALAIRRRAFDDVGGFDPGYFMYYEEVDLSRRLAAHGFATRFTPAASVAHVGGASTSKNRASMQRQMFRSLARYLRFERRGQRLMRLRLAVLAIACGRFARDVAMGSNGSIGSRAKHAGREWRSLVGDAVSGWRDG